MKRSTYVYVGSYASREDQAIACFRYDEQSGAWTAAGGTTGIENASYLAVDAERSRVYATSEIEAGRIVSYEADPTTGTLKQLGEAATQGAHPCYVSVHGDGGRYVSYANYSGRNAGMMAVRPDGSLELSVLVEHEGHSVDAGRQEAPHPHCAIPSPDGRFMFVVDLGIDAIVAYEADAAAKPGSWTRRGETAATPGAGPRHLVFHPSGAYAYCANELDSTVTAYIYDAAEGGLAAIGTYPLLPPGADPTGNSAADLHVHPNGRFLYASNRGHDSLACYEIDGETGALCVAGHTPTQGQVPRNFALSPDGRFVFVANQASDNIVGFAVDETTGRLEPTGLNLSVPKPVCIKFM